MNRDEKPDDKDIPGEGEAGVRMLSIHKSKGLEFPVVFIFDCARSSNRKSNWGLLNYHEEYGLVLNIPQAEELPVGGNFFLDVMAEEEKAKDKAELRRLLYVAMTRAEYKVFLTATLPRQTKEEKKEWDITGKFFDEDVIRRRLDQISEKPISQETFLTLVAPVLPDCPSSLCALEAIPVLSRSKISMQAHHADPLKGAAGQSGLLPKKPSQRQAALAAGPAYEEAEIIKNAVIGPDTLPASGLRYVKA